MKAFKNFVNGEWVDAKDGRTTPVVDPATGEQYAEAALSGDWNRSIQSANVWPGASACDAALTPHWVPLTSISSMTGLELSGPVQVNVAWRAAQSGPIGSE